MHLCDFSSFLIALVAWQRPLAVPFKKPIKVYFGGSGLNFLGRWMINSALLESSGSPALLSSGWEAHLWFVAGVVLSIRE